MTIRTIESTEKRDEILTFDFKVICSLCGEMQYSGFAKLYTYTYGKCEDCPTVEELKFSGENIFAITET